MGWKQLGWWQLPTAPLGISTSTTSPNIPQPKAAHEQVEKKYWAFPLNPLSQGNGQFATTHVCRASPGDFWTYGWFKTNLPERLGLEAHGISRCRVKEDFGPPLSHTEGNRTPHPGVRGQGTRFRKPCSISATNHGKTCPRLSLDFYAIIIMKEGTSKR